MAPPPAPPPAQPPSRPAGIGVWALAIFLVLAAAGGGWYWKHQRNLANQAPFPRDPELQRAHELIFGLDATVHDYEVAERIVKEALVRRPKEPEVAIVTAEVNNWYFLRGFDRSEARVWDMGQYARQAMQIAPDWPEAWVTMAEYLLARETELPRAAQLLRDALSVKPDVPRWHSSLAEALRVKDPAAGLAVLQSAVQRFPDDVLLRYNLARHYRDVGRLDDMERELDAAIVLKPLVNALLWKARVQLWAHGDLEGARQSLNRVPEPLRVSERAAVNLFVYAGLARQPDEALAVLRALPSDWIDDYDFLGPKGLLTGHLLAMQGHREEARLEFQKAYAEIARRQPASGDSLAARTAEVWTLLGLDRREEARAAHRVALSKVARPYRLGFFTSWWFSEIPAAIELGDRETAFQLLREAAGTVEGRRQLRVVLKVDPRMVALRDDPSVVALLAEPEADGR